MRGRALMIQGTDSHGGKSVITVALCRIFVQDDPFSPDISVMQYTGSSGFRWED